MVLDLREDVKDTLRLAGAFTNAHRADDPP